MSQFAITEEDCPRDCNGSPIRLGQTVWVANGWTGTTVNPWLEVVVDGIQFINGRYWIDITPNSTRSIPSYACSVEKVWQLATRPPKNTKPRKAIK